MIQKGNIIRNEGITKEYQNNALAKMINGGSIQDISSGFECPVVVIGRHALEREVPNGVGAEDSGEAAFGGGRGIGVAGGGSREGVR